MPDVKVLRTETQIAKSLSVGIFGPEELKLLRARLGLSQKELGEKCGVARATVQGWEGPQPHNPNPSAAKFLRELAKQAGF